jgi:hypothetical protein
MDLARWTMGDISIPRDVFLVHHRVTWSFGQDGRSDLDRNLPHTPHHTTILSPIHAHRGLSDMVLLRKVCAVHDVGPEPVN